MKDRKWDGGYQFKELKIKTTSREFKYSRRQVLAVGEKLAPSNISASWIADGGTGTGKLETLIGGVLQGRKQFDVRGASRVCKQQMWKLAIEVAGLAAVPAVGRCLQMTTYKEVKRTSKERVRVKIDVRSTSLKGWIRNVGGEDFRVSGAEL